MALVQKHAVGLFSTQQQVESALSELKQSGFEMEQVSVVHQPADKRSGEDAQESAEGEAKIESLTGSEVLTEAEYDRDRNLEPIAKAALNAGAWGSLGGGLVAGISALALPAVGGAVTLVGLAAGGFYGAASGGLIGGATGVGLSTDEAKYYDSQLDKGDYLVMIEGSEAAVDGAKSVLESFDIRDLTVFEAL